ncbi:MAG: spore coat associated protein CotJA [Ruminococcaceae bacterium]|nr:spore coat associated protein CotJA [Oscillospiraceae bacterium]
MVCDIPLSELKKLKAKNESSSEWRIAQAWVPKQSVGSEMYSACEGLNRGTIYPVLDKPYECKLDMKSEGGCHCD